jgi:hypothetical protein
LGLSWNRLKKGYCLRILAKHKDVTLNLFYTPTHLTDNALIFQEEHKWWQEGYDYALNKSEIMSDLK